MKNLKDAIALRFVQLVLAWTVLALSFEIFMMVTMVVNPDLMTKIGNEIEWKIDGTFKNDPNNIWYEGPKSK
jgi:hypothetical protein